MYAEPLMLGNLFAMESLKDIAEWKMMESLNIGNMVKFFLARKRYRAARLGMKSNTSFVVKPVEE